MPPRGTVCCLSRNATVQPPCYRHGKERHRGQTSQVHCQLVEKVPVSDLCEEYKIRPSVLYQWQNTVFDNLRAVLESSGDESAARQRERRALTAKVDLLEARLAKKDAVIAEISARPVATR